MFMCSFQKPLSHTHSVLGTDARDPPATKVIPHHGAKSLGGCLRQRDDLHRVSFKGKEALKQQ